MLVTRPESVPYVQDSWEGGTAVLCAAFSVPGWRESEHHELPGTHTETNPGLCSAINNCCCIEDKLWDGSH